MDAIKHPAEPLSHYHCGMRENNRVCRIGAAVISAAIVVGLTACASAPPPVPAPGQDRVVEERVRAPSAGSGEELQVFGVRNPAVVALGRDARAAEEKQDLERAEMLLERALRIDGRDPAILQQMAEIQLARGRLGQAGTFAQRSFELGPQVGEICQRSLRTLVVVHERNGAWDRAQQARGRLKDCRVAPPDRF